MRNRPRVVTYNAGLRRTNWLRFNRFEFYCVLIPMLVIRGVAHPTGGLEIAWNVCLTRVFEKVPGFDMVYIKSPCARHPNLAAILAGVVVSEHDGLAQSFPLA